MKQISEKKMHRSSRMRYLWITLLMLLAGSGVTLAGLLDGNVAKVGDTEYAKIEEAIAAWGPGKTLTLLQDVTTTSTVEVEVNATKSAQNWILNLGDHTWTANGCNAIHMFAAGGTPIHQNYGLKINANQSGGITASGKYVVYYTNQGSCSDSRGYRPRLEINGGTYNASYVVYYSTFAFSSTANGASVFLNKSADGSEPIFNGNFALSKCPVTVNAGYFNGTSFSVYRVSSTVDPCIYGGHFKTISAFPTPGNDKGIVFGSYRVYYRADASLDVVSSKPNGYEAEASKSLVLSTNRGKLHHDYVYFEKANDAIQKYSSGVVDIILAEGVTATANKSFSSGTLTIDASAAGSAYTGTINLAGNSATFITKFPEGGGHYGVTVSNGQLHVEESTSDGIVTRTYTVTNAVSESEAVAKIGTTYYRTIFDAFYAVDGTEGKTITLLKDVSDAGFVTNGKAVNGTGKTDVTFDLNGHSIGFTTAGVEKDADYTLTIVDGSQDKTGVVTNSLATFTTLALENMINLTGQYDMKIQAGTWQFNPSAISFNSETRNLVDEGYYARDNGNGTWTVGELPAVAKIGDVKYRTLDAAVAAANEGDLIEVLIADTYTLPGLPKNVTIQGNVEGVVFNHTTAGSIASVPNGATFKNVSFNFGNVNYHGFQHAGTINMEGCTLNGKFFSYGDMNFTNCQFTQSNSDYHMWAYSGNLTYTGCTFTNSVTGKFLNVYNESGATKYTVTCTDCKFINNASAANKAAINVKATSGSNLLAYDVIINNCTTEGAFPEASTSDALYVLNSIAQVDDRTASGVDNITVTQDGVLIYPITVAKIGETKYPTLQSAVNAAQQMGGDVTITLLDDISGETVTIKEFANFKVTIDGKKDANTNYTIDGQIIIDGLRGNGGSVTNGASVTLQNIAFINGEAKDVILASHYPHNLTIQDCTYTGSAASSNNWFVNVSDGPLYGTTVKNVTVEHSRLIQLDLSADAVFENIVATNDVTCGFNIKTGESGGFTGTVLIKNCQVTTAKYAFRDYKDSYNGTITLEGNTFISTSEESDEGVIVNRGGAVGTGHINVVSGTYTGHLKVLNNKEGVLALSGGYFSEEFPQNYIAEDLVAQGKACVPATDKEGYYTIGDPHYVAQIGETKYVSLQAALDAAHEMTGDVTVELIDNIEGYSIVHQKSDLNLTIDGADKTLAGQIIIDGDGRASGTETLTIQNVKFEGNTTNFYSGSDAFILVPNVKDGSSNPYYTGKYNYAHNITVTDCSFTSNSTSEAYDVVGIKATSGAGAYNVVINNCTASGTKMHSLAQFTGTTGGSVTNCTVTGSESFMNVNGGAGEFTVSGNTFTSAEGADGYGIRENGSSTAVITLTDNTFTAANSVVLGKGSNVTAGTIKVESGVYTGALSKTEAATGKIAISGGYFSEEFPQDFIAENLVAEGKACVPATDMEGYFTVGIPHYVAQIGETKYVSLQAAVDAVPTDGTETTIVMIDDETVVGNSGVTIPVGKNVVLNLNGKTIMLSVTESKGSQLITNQGTLTITDNSEGQNGKLTNEASESLAVGSWPTNNYVTNVITNSGTLNVEAGTIQNTANGSICYAIDNNNTSYDAVLNIKGGTMTAVGTVVRQFCNSTTKKNELNISGGEVVTNGYAAIWTQLPGDNSASKKLATLNISGGKVKGGTFAWYDYSYGDSFEAVEYSITGGYITGYLYSYAVANGVKQGFITGGFFSEEFGYAAPGKACIDNTDEATKEEYPYTVGEAEVYYSWVEDGATVGEYTLFTKPFDNNWLMDGEFITLLKNITMDKDVVCQLTSGAFTLTFGEYDIDLNGHVFPIPLGVTILTDKQTDIFSATDPDYKVVETATETGYAYTIVPKVYVAQYNNVKYETLQAAFDAAEADDPENIVIDLLADATLDITARANVLSIGTENTKTITINGHDKTLSFNQKNSDWNDVSTANDEQTKLILNDMTITSTGYNNGPWNRHDINFSCDVTLNSVTSDKALALKNGATLSNVTITDTGDVYGIWIQPNGQTVNIDGLTLTAGRGIKIDDQYVDAPQLTTLNIQNATFDTTKKAAILLKAGAGAVVNAGEGINITNAATDTQNLVWVDEDRATEYYKYTTTGASMKPETKEEDYVASLRRGDQIRGYYKTFAAAYNSADYANGDFYQLHQTTTEAVVVNKELTIIKNGYTADNVTAAEGFQREETLKKIVISPTVPEHPYEIADGYYRIKNLGNGSYVNVIGRRSATISTSEADALSLAGTVIKVNAPEGKVETLRSQAVDIPHYAERAMTYVPEFVEMVVQKLGVEGSGEILGTTGVDAIMDKFNKNFDYHLHTEQAGDGAVRIYGKTPRMKPVVEFYEENKDKVDAKLPQLEEAINDAIDKVVDKLGRGESLRNSFNLHKVWERMSGTLTEPVDEASKVAFMQEVLMDEAYVWDFGYQAVMIYVEKVENSSVFDQLPAELKKYWNLAKQTHPDFKYYIVQKDGQMDIISEGNIDIINDNDRTKWVLEPAENFDVDFTIGNMDGEYFATIYTDFGYQLPSGVTAYKVTGIDDNDVAQIEEIGQAVAAQTPVLLKSTTGSGTKTLSIGNYGTSVSGNQLHGADWVINEYDIKNSTVQGLFEIVASVSQSVANEYDYLTSLNSGTVGNKYFFPVTVDGQLSDAYKAKTGNEMNDTPIHYLGVTEEGKVGFVKSWDTIAANAVYMFNETIDPIYLDEPEYPANIAEGYYRIKNDGNNSYVNVRGRRTATVNATEADTKTLPGTVLKVKATNGEVEILRSQAVDLPYYAQRAMSYVPDVVELVVNKLGVDGSGEILGSTGVDAIMQKFNESFDYHLHVEFSSPEAAEGTDTLSNLRIYGKTPSMRPVVEFYQEHKDQVDAKLPMLESEINAAIQKVVEKAGMGSSLLNSFKLETIWTRMGGTLTKPTDNASKLAFLKEVLASETNVWNFAYQTATFYMEKVEGSSVFDQIPAEIRQYWNLAKQVHPNFKYYIVQKDGKMDFISEGNIDIQNNAARTTWSLEPITEFTVNIPETNSKLVGKDKKEYYTTLYTDFGYQLPEGVTALKVTEIKDVQELGLAVTEEIGREVAPQTPVLIKSETAGDITLTIGDNFGSAVTGNLLHGTDWLINEFEINTPSIESLFNIFKDKISASTAEQYEYLLRRNSGTVNNKYFFPINAEDITTALENKGKNGTPIRILDKNGKFLAFYDTWELPSNAVFIYSEDYKPVFLYLIGDVDRDGDIDLDDVNATIDIVLSRDTEEDNYDYEAADVDETYEEIDGDDVNTLIDLVLDRISLKSLIEKILKQ